MRKITKGQQPVALTTWKRNNPHHRYDDLAKDPQGIRLAIRQTCLQEQYYLCAYCCKTIGVKDRDCMNEHILPQEKYPQKSLDFANIVSSCTSKQSCDATKKNQLLAISPLDSRCETELKFNLDGTVRGLSDDAWQSIKVLNLGDTRQSNKALVEVRKQTIENYLFSQGAIFDDLLDDQELASLLIAELSQPKNGKLDAFAPVIAQVLADFVGIET